MQHDINVPSSRQAPTVAIPVPQQPLIHSYLPLASSSSSSSLATRRSTPTSQQKKQWTLMLLRMTVEMNVSFRAVTECEVLKEFLAEELGWKMPSRWTLTRLLPTYHLYLVNQLRSRLIGVESLSITTDSTFLTRHQVPYICITGHWIDEDWQLQNAVLAVFLADQSETASFIINRLKDILETQLGVVRRFTVSQLMRVKPFFLQRTCYEV
jgi:hypothetical protein